MTTRFKLFVPLALLSLSLSPVVSRAANEPVPPPPENEGTLTPPPPIVTAEPPPLSETPSDQTQAPAPTPSQAQAQVPPSAPPTASAPVAPPAPPEEALPPEAPTPQPTAAAEEPPSAAPPIAPLAPLPPEVPPTPSPKKGPFEEITVAQEESAPGDTFQLLRPAWAVRTSFSPFALGGKDVSGGQLVPTKGVSIGFEYQPKAWQKLGVFSIGPSFDVYPIIPQRQDIQNNPYTIISVGGELRYQARFFREQLLVPEVAYAVDRLSVRTLTGSSTQMTVTGPEGGLYLLLNPLEPSQAFEFYKNVGALRTYLTAEARDLVGTSGEVAISGLSYYFGIRVEF